jgi:hypothetical protein
MYSAAQSRNQAPFHEADGFGQATFNDLIQETINQGHVVNGLEVSTGWIEIHQRVDVERAEKELEMIRLRRSQAWIP